MKYWIKYTFTLIAIIFASVTSFGQTALPAAGGALSGTYSLSGTVNLQNPITIANGKTLTITGSGTIKAAKAMAQMFNVDYGGKLIITGTSDTKHIVIDGGAVLATGANNKLTKTGGISLTAEAIINKGTLTMSNVTLQNVYIDDSKTGDSGGGIYIIGTEGKNGPTTLTNCTIQKCVSRHGAALHITAQDTKTHKNTPNGCSVTLNGCKIQNCYADTKNEGGTIRTNGSAVSNLHIINTIVQNNRSDGFGGGLYWNAKGDPSTKLTLDGSTFQNNSAEVMGGGMMLETDFEFVGGTTRVYDNYTTSPTGHGGGIVVTSYSGGGIPGLDVTFNFNLNDKLEVKGNKATNGAGISFNLTTYGLNPDFNAEANNKPSTKVTANVNVDGGIITDNIATGHGGGIRLFNNTQGNNGNRTIVVNIKMNRGTLSGNKAAYGAGVYTYKADVTNDADSEDVISMSNNIASVNGGAICVDGGKNITLYKNNMISNSAQNGAGIYISGESGLNVTFNGTTLMQGNSASVNGGGVYINGGNLNINDNSQLIENTAISGNGGAVYIGAGGMTVAENKIAVFESNSSAQGGGAFISGGTLNVKGDIHIEDNKATNEGGGIYVNSGDVSLADCYVSGNKAGYDKDGIKVNDIANGGALSIHNGSVNIIKGDVTVNTSTQYGGGIYVANNETDMKTLKLLGDGVFTKNEAKAGGGMYVRGNVSLEMSGNINDNKAVENGGGIYMDGSNMDFTGDVIANQAINGGGIYMANGSSLLVKGGLIKLNEAVGEDGTDAPKSAYYTSADKLHGIGGGIYLDSGVSAENMTTIDFDISGTIGIYENYAKWGADDLFANGKYTSAVLPNIAEMDLTGFIAPTDILYWAEDYISNDTNYDKGTMVFADWGNPYKVNERYDAAIKNAQKIYYLNFTQDKQKYDQYLCLTIGYEIIFVELLKKGLLPGENAVFQISSVNKGDQTVSSTPYLNVVFKCTKADQTTDGIKQVVALPSGLWQIKESPWTWAYNGPEPIIENISKENYQFELTNIRKDDDRSISDEAIITNRMKN